MKNFLYFFLYVGLNDVKKNKININFWFKLKIKLKEKYIEVKIQFLKRFYLP